MKILGAIIGDVCGAPYEKMKAKDITIDPFNEFAHYTDDTVLTVASMDYLLHEKPRKFEDVDPIIVSHYYRYWAKKYPNSGYGKTFKEWFRNDTPGATAQSWGNGCCMRVSPFAHYFELKNDLVMAAAQSACITHDYLDSIHATQMVAHTMWMVKQGWTNDAIADEIMRCFLIQLKPLSEIRPTHTFTSKAIETAPIAIQAFLESHSFESTLRLAISVGGDVDTNAAIACGISAMRFDIPQEFIDFVMPRLTGEFINVINEFNLLIGEKNEG